MFDYFPDVVTIDDIMQMLNIGRSSVYALLHTNRIRHVKVGRKFIIPKRSVVEFLDSMCYNDDQIMDGGLIPVSKGDATL